MAVNQSAIGGEDGTGYESPLGRGPFECANCEYYIRKTSSCKQKDMKAKSKRPRLPDGSVEIEANGCCAYQERPEIPVPEIMAKLISEFKSSIKR